MSDLGGDFVPATGDVYLFKLGPRKIAWHTSPPVNSIYIRRQIDIRYSLIKMMYFAKSLLCAAGLLAIVGPATALSLTAPDRERANAAKVGRGDFAPMVNLGFCEHAVT